MLVYRVELTPDDNGTLLVTCPDLPEVATFGEDEQDALAYAVGAIEEALAARMAHKEEIPLPRQDRAGVLVRLSAQMESKIQRYEFKIQSQKS